MALSVNSRDKSINIWLNITGENAKDLFDMLYSISYDNSLIEVHPSLVWDKMEGRKICAVTLKQNGDFSNKSEWPTLFAWFKEYSEKFTKYFKPKVANL